MDCGLSGVVTEVPHGQSKLCEWGRRDSGLLRDFWDGWYYCWSHKIVPTLGLCLNDLALGGRLRDLPAMADCRTICQEKLGCHIFRPKLPSYTSCSYHSRSY